MVYSGSDAYFTSLVDISRIFPRIPIPLSLFRRLYSPVSDVNAALTADIDFLGYGYMSDSRF